MGVLTGCRLAKATAVAGFLAATAACADVNTDANALFVRAVQAWTAAAALPADDPGKADERIALLRQVNANLDQIINELPGSDIAVRLITGETLGPITLDGARDALVQISAAVSCANRAGATFIDWRSIFGVLGVAHVQRAVPGEALSVAA